MRLYGLFLLLVTPPGESTLHPCPPSPALLSLLPFLLTPALLPSNCLPTPTVTGFKPMAWHDIGPSGAQQLHHLSTAHSLTQPPTELLHSFFSPHTSLAPLPSFSLWAEELEFYFSKKAEAVRGEFPRAPTRPLLPTFICSHGICLPSWVNCLCSFLKPKPPYVHWASFPLLYSQILLQTTLSFLSCIPKFPLHSIFPINTQNML